MSQPTFGIADRRDDPDGSFDIVDAAYGATGTVQVADSFAPFGARRGSDWQGAPSAADLTAIGNSTPDGFTGHEMLDGVGLIHMNGRVYDPAVGRFLSVDPIVRAVDASQSWNGYGYVEGRTLSWTDPSGWTGTDTNGKKLPRSAWISSYGYYTGDTTPAWRENVGPNGVDIVATTPQRISTGSGFGFGDFSRSNGGSGSPVSVSEAQEVDREPRLAAEDAKAAVPSNEPESMRCSQAEAAKADQIDDPPIESICPECYLMGVGRLAQPDWQS